MNCENYNYVYNMIWLIFVCVEQVHSFFRLLVVVLRGGKGLGRIIQFKNFKNDILLGLEMLFAININIVENRVLL